LYYETEQIFYCHFIIHISLFTASAQSWQAQMDSCSFYQEKQDYQTALLWADKAEAKAKAQFGEKDTNYIASLNSIYLCYYNIGNLEKAIEYCEKVKPIIKEVRGEESPEYAETVGNLGTFYNQIANYIKAEPLLKEALEMSRRLFKGDHPDIATYINNMAYFYDSRGRFAEAEPLYKEALEMYKRLFKGDHPALANSINNMAAFYNDRGRYAEAEPLYKEALEMRRRLFREDHPELAQSINNMAGFYDDRGRYAEAEPLYKEALEMFRLLFKGDHPDLAVSINNIAGFYNDRGRYAEAETLFKEALEMYKRLFKGDHPALANSILNMASFYYTLGRYKEAEPLYKEAIEMYRRIFKGDHPALANSINNIATFYSGLGRLDEAEPLYNELINVCSNLLNNYFPSLSEKEKDQYFNTFSKYYLEFNNFAVSRFKESPQLLESMFDNQLLTKGMLLNASNKVRSRILSSNDTALIKLFSSWKDKKEYISKLYQLPKAQLEKKNLNLDSIIQSANEQEKEMTKRYEVFRQEYDKKKVEWEDVQNTLKLDEAAVEIVRFRYFYKSRFTDTVYYAALILRRRLPPPAPKSSGGIKLVLLKNGNELEEKYINNYKKCILNQIPDNDSYIQFWEPINKELRGIKKVYVSLDGVYNQLNLETLFNPQEGKYLIDETDVQVVSSTRDLVERNEDSRFRGNNSLINTAELFGDPKFNLDSTQHEMLSSNYIKADNANMERGIIDSLMTRGGISALPGTRNEIDNIYRLFKAEGWKVNEHIGENALEEALKSVKSPRILHITTHGVFLNDIDKSNQDDRMFGMATKRFAENPLLRSMLLFAGAENTINKKGDNTTDTRTDDGLLTAYEAQNLNLDETDLVVLSACETGLGEIKNGEGVYGLQRAFIEAGAKSLIMSLWKVSDEATQELMTSFYSNWLSGKTKRQAFREAQQELMKQHPQPYYWGAFVLVGE
jgi:CHAT domain-containing protein/Flp pilus assembly protein TadD